MDKVSVFMSKCYLLKLPINTLCNAQLNAEIKPIASNLFISFYLGLPVRVSVSLSSCLLPNLACSVWHTIQYPIELKLCIHL